MNSGLFRDLARVLEVAAAECRRIDSERASDRRDWVSQSESPLGSRTHIKAVRRRIQEGRDGAAKVGRRFLLEPAALREELKAPRAQTIEPPDEGEQLRGELQLLRGGAR